MSGVGWPVVDPPKRTPWWRRFLDWWITGPNGDPVPAFAAMPVLAIVAVVVIAVVSATPPSP